MVSWDFSGKHVLVVGGTSGINRGIARSFAEQGAKVAVVSRTQARVDDTVTELSAIAELTGLGGAAAGFSADVRDYEQFEAGLLNLMATWGHLDVVVSGAAGNFPALAAQMSPRAFASVVNIDLLGTYHVMRAVYPFLTRPGSSVINISAPQAQVAILAQAHVSAAKAGVDMLTRSLALEWSGEGIRVNSVIPGPIDGTEGMARLAPTEAMRDACVLSVPLQRMGKPEDIANACLFLASPLASYITGVVLPVDGGWVLGGVAALSSGFSALVGKPNHPV